MPQLRTSDHVNTPAYEALQGMEQQARFFRDNVNAFSASPIWIRDLRVDLIVNSRERSQTLQARVVYAERYNGLVDQGFFVNINIEDADLSTSLTTFYAQAWECLKQHIIATLLTRVEGNRSERRAHMRHPHRMAHHLPPRVQVTPYVNNGQVHWQRLTPEMVVSTMEPMP